MSEDPVTGLQVAALPVVAKIEGKRRRPSAMRMELDPSLLMFA